MSWIATPTTLVRGSHYWHTPKAGGKVDKDKPTQFGRAMGDLGIEMIAGYSPQARGRSERFFATLQGRLPQELARAGITEMEEANDFLKRGCPGNRCLPRLVKLCDSACLCLGGPRRLHPHV